MTGRLAARTVVATVATVAIARLANAQPAPAIPATTAAPAEPDPAVAQASDANLESTSPRRGVVFTVALGGGLIAGLGVASSTGRGPAVSVRLGRVATPTTVLAFELTATGALHRTPNGSAIKTNADTHLLVSAQHWLNDSLWLRAGGGLGIYQAQGVRPMVDAMGHVVYGDDPARFGPALLGGAGVEIVRIRTAVLGLEAAVAATVNRDGVLLSNYLNLALSFD